MIGNLIDLNNSKLTVCGGAGFIGSHFVKLVNQKYPSCRITVIDSLTYAGNLNNLKDADYEFKHGDITSLKELDCDYLVNFAAETHNDRSILNPEVFYKTNILGVANLCTLVKAQGIVKFVNVGTDEEYGSILEGQFFESSPLRPNSPYSASKASASLICQAMHNTYGTPVCVTRGGNTYGSHQYPEKLIPFFLTRLLNDKKVPVYGDGLAVREWIHVVDHAEGILKVLEYGTIGEAYNIGDEHSIPNIELIKMMIGYLGKSDDLIKYIPDPRANAHDFRYSLNTEKIRELGWMPRHLFCTGFEEAVDWYAKNRDWWEPIIATPDFMTFVEKYYGKLLDEDL